MRVLIRIWRIFGRLKYLSARAAAVGALANGERGRGDRLTTPLTWLKPLAAHMRQNLYFAPNGTTLAPPRLNTTGTLLLFTGG
jgi:hypothetical protein